MHIDHKPKRDVILYAAISKPNKKFLETNSKKTNRSISELTNMIIEEARINASKKSK